MDSIYKEHERLLKDSNLSKPISSIDKIITLLTAARAQIAEDPSSSTVILEGLGKQLKPAISAVNDDQKDVYAALGKYGKALDKKFKASAALASSDYNSLSEKSTLINRAIVMHLIREGNFEVASTFLREAAEKGEYIEISDNLTRDFRELYDILDAMRLRLDLEPAISWARRKSAELDARGSNLEFELCRLKYIWLFMGEGKGEPGNQKAFFYARKELSGFQGKYLSEVQRLVAAYAYLPGITHSPYAKLFVNLEGMWEDASRSFTKEFCSLLGLSAESPLYIAATAGAIALPTLLKMANIMKEKKTEWSTVHELPVEIPLPPRYQYHSIFVCPVSKEQTTETNPPMMLPCGHVIAQESLQRLGKGHTATTLKCPYCPRECTAAQAKRVYL